MTKIGAIWYGPIEQREIWLPKDVQVWGSPFFLTKQYCHTVLELKYWMLNHQQAVNVVTVSSILPKINVLDLNWRCYTNTSEFSKGISCQLGVVFDHLKVHHKALLSLGFIHYMQTQENKEIFLLSGQIYHDVWSSQHLLLEEGA